MSAAQNLSLSNNLIKVIPGNTFEALKSLKFLFLDHNRIEIITADTFNGLKQLEYLTLAYNNLKKWHGSLSADLPKLEFLDVTGNTHFNIRQNKKLLTNNARALKTILGATTSKDCKQCNWTRTDVPRKLLLKPKGCEFIPSYNMPLIDQFQKKYLYFNGTCDTKSCALSLVVMSKVRRVYRNHCWDKARTLRPIEYILGVVAMVFNLVVIVTILCSNTLIKKTSMFLTAHLAFGDLFLAVFSITIANGHGIMSDSGLRQWRQHECPYFRSLLIFGQTIEALTSVLMTIERYLVIVHCMRPNLRINLRLACVLCAFICIFGALSCFVIERFDHLSIRDNFMCVLVQDFRNTQRFMGTQVLMLLFVALYLAVLAMYIHIYIAARKSAKSAGMQRETSLAKRISVIVFSNMVFYAVPNLCIVVFAAANIKVTSDREVNFILTIWLPPICMITNACLNPFLFAFRNEAFLKSLKEVVRTIISRLLWGKRLLFSKVHHNGGMYVVNYYGQVQTSSQITLNESFELGTT
ncbi:putative glycoprotein hormone G-protein coupled receptor [Oculina patagonica]